MLACAALGGICAAADADAATKRTDRHSGAAAGASTAVPREGT